MWKLILQVRICDWIDLIGSQAQLRTCNDSEGELPDI